MLSNSSFKKIASNFGWLFSDNLIKNGVGAVVGIWVARHLGPELFGIYSYAIIFASFFSAFVGLGFHKIIVREISKDATKSKSLIGTSFYSMLITGALLMILCPLTLKLMRPDDSLTLTLVSIMSIGFMLQAFHSLSYYFEATTDMKKVVWASNTSFFIGVVIKFFAIYFNASLHWFVLATMIDLALASLFLLFFIPKKIGSLSGLSFDKNIAVSILKDAYPLIISVFAVKIYADIDQIMIRDLFNAEETGKYAIAVKISRIWSFIPSAIFVSVFPNLNETKKVNEKLYKEKLQKLYKFVVFISYIVAIVTTFSSSIILPYLLGSGYNDSSFLLNILIWSSLFASLGGARTLFLLSENMTRIYMMTVVIGCILNIVLNFIFIPKYGGVAACVTTLITTFVAGIGLNFFIPRLKETGIMQIKSLFFPKFW